MPKKPEIKISKNAKALIKNSDPDLKKLFARKQLKNNLPAKIYIQNAKLIATNVKNKKDAMQLLQDFYDFSALRGRVQIVRPSSKNRKYYASTLGISKRFKYFPMPVHDDVKNPKFKINKTEGTIDIAGNNIDMKFFPFPSYKKLASDTTGEIEKIKVKIEKHLKKSKKKFTRLRIKAGEFETKFSTSIDDNITDSVEVLTGRVKEYMHKYTDTKQWLRGVVMYSFLNQEPEKDSLEKLTPARKKKKASKRARVRAK